MPIKSDDPDYVTSLARGLGIIACFGQNAETLTLSEIAMRINLSRGTTRRFLLTLEALGYLRCDGKRFRLSPKTLDLGYAYLSSVPLWRVALPLMQDVVDEIDESCSLGVLEKCDVVYIARTPPKHLSYLPLSAGARMPAHSNAMGQVLLANLSSDELDSYFRKAKLEKLTKHTMTDEKTIRGALAVIAKSGYAFSDGQTHATIRSIAVPIRTRLGRVEASLNVSAYESRASKQQMLRHFLPVLQRAAAQLSRTL